MSEPARNGTSEHDPEPGWEELRRGTGAALLALTAAAEEVLGDLTLPAAIRFCDAAGSVDRIAAQISRAIGKYEEMLAEEAAMRHSGCARCASCPRCRSALTVLPGGLLGQPD